MNYDFNKSRCNLYESCLTKLLGKNQKYYIWRAVFKWLSRNQHQSNRPSIFEFTSASLSRRVYAKSLCHEVEPRHATTPLIRPYLCYDHLLVAPTKAHTLSCMKTPLIRPPVITTNDHPFLVPNRYLRYNFTPLIRLVKLSAEWIRT